VLQAADTPAVTIAVLRGDGVLVPIATRRGTSWTHTWPVPAKKPDVPLALDDVPKRWWGRPGPTASWYAWQIDGSTSRVTVERPIWYLAHCQQGIGLQTSLTARPPLPPPTIQPYPKLGVASTSELPFRRIEPVDQRDALWKPVADAVATELAKAEDKMGLPLMNVEATRLHPFSKEARAKAPVKVEALYRAPLADGRVLYYVEATKQYGMPPLAAESKAPAPTPRAGCSVMTFGQGWFVAREGEPIKPKMVARLSSCDYADVQLMLPLAFVPDSTDPVWIGQLTGWNNESYVVMRWDPSQADAVPVYQTHGGWCLDD
jgi:hypothetical protein